MHFWISDWISGFQSGFLDFRIGFPDFTDSGFQFGLLDFTVDFWISVWISVDSVRHFFRDGPLGVMRCCSTVSDGSVVLATKLEKCSSNYLISFEGQTPETFAQTKPAPTLLPYPTLPRRNN